MILRLFGEGVIDREIDFKSNDLMAASITKLIDVSDDVSSALLLVEYTYEADKKEAYVYFEKQQNDGCVKCWTFPDVKVLVEDSRKGTTYSLIGKSRGGRADFHDFENFKKVISEVVRSKTHETIRGAICYAEATAFVDGI